jgi:predicted transcriptional regulator
MDVVWSKKLERFAVADVLAVLSKKRTIAYTTVMTTVARLHDKGLLRRERAGKRYLYSPVMGREDFLHHTAREVLDELGSSQRALALLVDTVARADAGTLDELERLIRARREKERE